MDFASWDAGLHASDPNALQHHGIPGMRWGVRKYQNKDGSLTPAGEARYGAKETKRTSARKMQRDFNALDRGYAQATAESLYNAKKVRQTMRKANRAERKGKTEKAEKLKSKALESAKKASLNNKQRKAIEQLQWKIIGKAAKEGYTTRSKPVVRLANTGRQRAIAAGLGALVGGGALTGAVMGAYLAKKAVKVSGQNIRIKKRGSGGTQVVNYAANKNLYYQQQKQEEARKRKDYYHR